ncbi:MAG: hypothetical protein A7316_10530 [Candidatus Altiarchaeales archaeon WOR_SM1_86-2]|nr:MAG: hypothetical protein A7316_10530 [Candidatus Altiarchaeales archaeon WOR_SM1_86-2]
MKMKLIEDILIDLKENYIDSKVRDVRVGITWTAVLSRNCGLGYTFHSSREAGVRGAGKLTEKTAFGLAEYIKSWNFTEASKNKNIAMVGHFPHSEEIKAAAKNLWIIEKNPYLGDFPAEASDYLIPKADIAVISGTTLINKSMEHLLELCRDNRVYTIILGPSTLMSPVLFDYGADMLAGCRVINIERMLKKVSHGAGLVKEFKDDIEFVVIDK